LLGASYGGNLVSVNPVGPEGLVAAEATALLRLGRNPHCIRTDPSERFVYVPHLGSDLIFQFLFDDKTGALTANRPAFIATGFESGPRHLVFSPNHRFAYVLTELSGEVICFSLDPQSGTLTERQRISIVPPGSGLVPGGYRPPVNAKDPGHQGPAKIWGAEIRLTADGSHLYASERSSSTIACFHADSMSGRLEYHGSVPTETQPRGFAIDPKGRFLVASGEVSNHATSYAIDPATGALREVCRVETAAGPNWVEIVNFR
ncbi:MAG: lactonase family protein, partial [Planctomycetes bacterium]|nr:lactonase family protein [Planctomycetota bacterium]